MGKKRSGLFVVLAFLAACGRPASLSDLDGVLRVALHTEPQSWNRMLAADRVTHVVTDQLHEPLLRVNPETQQVEPALAESWEFSEDGRRLVLRLRQGVRFSDGSPLEADDVAFTFRALYDPQVGSPLLDTALIDGKQLEVEIVDPTTVAFHLPRRTATIERIFDSIPILPAHRLEKSLARGSLPVDTGLGAAPEAIIGLGPFLLREHVPGERIVLERNPYYWMDGEGAPCPRLSRLVFEIVPDENARLLRFRAGEIDVLELLTPESFERLREEGAPELELLDLGPGLLSERLWFNLSPNAAIEEHKKLWFADARFRHAMSMAIDRNAMARVVFSGRATPASGPVSQANSSWRDGSLLPTPYDPDKARKLLLDAGFRWDRNGKLRDAAGNEVGFTILTNTGNQQHARMGAFIQEDLSKLGVEAPTVPLEGPTLLARFTGKLDYEAGLLGISQTDPDPSAEMAFWLSRGPLHLWNPRQAVPATPWEARIDELMERQLSELDPGARRESYFELQRIVCEQLPVVDLVVPHVLVGRKRRVENFRPTPFAHALWNSEELSVGDADAEAKATSKLRDSRH